MAGDWIKMRTNLGSDPDVIAMASHLGLDEFSVVGRLHAVWAWLDSHSDDGTNVRVSSAFLDRLANLPGFSEAMRMVDWLGGKDGAIRFPGYTEHNGETAKRRGLETQRKRKQRDKCPNNDGTHVPRKLGLEKRREEKSTDTHKPPGRAVGRGRAEELEAYAVEIEMPSSDGTACHDKWTGNGWTNDGRQIKDWRATMRNWKAQGYLPSQRAKAASASNGGPRSTRGPDRIPTTETTVTPDMLKL